MMKSKPTRQIVSLKTKEIMFEKNKLQQYDHYSIEKLNFILTFKKDLTIDEISYIKELVKKMEGIK